MLEKGQATVFPGRSIDDEASAILDQLSRLQHLMVMQMGRGPEWIAAADLVQRTRVLIIERCKRPSVLTDFNPDYSDGRKPLQTILEEK